MTQCNISIFILLREIFLYQSTYHFSVNESQDQGSFITQMNVTISDDKALLVRTLNKLSTDINLSRGDGSQLDYFQFAQETTPRTAMIFLFSSENCVKLCLLYNPYAPSPRHDLR